MIRPCRNLGRSKIPTGKRSSEKGSVVGLVSGFLEIQCGRGPCGEPMC